MALSPLTPANHRTRAPTCDLEVVVRRTDRQTPGYSLVNRRIASTRDDVGGPQEPALGDYFLPTASGWHFTRGQSPAPGRG